MTGGSVRRGLRAAAAVGLAAATVLAAFYILSSDVVRERVDLSPVAAAESGAAAGARRWEIRPAAEEHGSGSGSGFFSAPVPESDADRCQRLAGKALVDLMWICDHRDRLDYAKWWASRFTAEEAANLSPVGRASFLGEKLSLRENRTKEGATAAPFLYFMVRMLFLFPVQDVLTIGVWKHGVDMERRLFNRYTETRFDPLEKCSVKNCRIVYEDKEVFAADAVLFHLHKHQGGAAGLPKTRDPRQRWTFMTDESPHFTFYAEPYTKKKVFNGVFNWSMSYRSDSDVPVPYGRTVMLKKDRPNFDATAFAANKTKLAAILLSNCQAANRLQLAHALGRDMAVDVYGHCNKDPAFGCAGHFTRDCEPIGDYKFYLSWENSRCREYITEKLWWNAYRKGAVPIVMGGRSRGDYERLAPPRSFLQVDDFRKLADLAAFADFLGSRPAFLGRLHEWRRRFHVINEHGYFGAPILHYCRLCEALNADDGRPKVYKSLPAFWGVKRDCTAS